jgi:hypothetical protein
MRKITFGSLAFRGIGFGDWTRTPELSRCIRLPQVLRYLIYGLAFDKRNDYIWYADLNGNNIRRFDAKTEKAMQAAYGLHQ